MLDFLPSDLKGILIQYILKQNSKSIPMINIQTMSLFSDKRILISFLFLWARYFFWVYFWK